MPLDNNILGEALYNARKVFNDTDMTDLVAQYGTLEGVRLAMATADATAIITHFTTNGTVPSLGLVAPDGPVTGVAKIV